VLHCGAPYYDAPATAAILSRVRAEFAVVRPFGAYIPLYGTYLLFAVASQSLDVQAVGKSDITSWTEKHDLVELRYYGPEMHHALFSIPPFLRNALGLA
jgi:spermidine synthase